MSTRKVEMESTAEGETIAVEDVVDERLTDTETVDNNVSDEEILEPVDEEVELESLDPDEELWPDGPTAGQILQWKEKHNDVYVSSFPVGVHVVWRAMNRGEYKEMLNHIEQATQMNQLTQSQIQFYQEEYIAKKCILFPDYSSIESDNGLAGIPSLIAQEVFEASGFVALEVRQL